MSGFFETPVVYLKGVGPQRAALLNKDLNIFTFGDLIQHYPFRYEDRTKFYTIAELNEELPFVQLKGKVVSKEVIGEGFKKRLVAQFTDGTGIIELVWFQGINWVVEKVKPGIEYITLGKPNRFGSKFSIAHAELEPISDKNEKGGFLQPVYPLTEKLRTRHIDSKAIYKLQQELLQIAKDKIRETLPASVLSQHQLISKTDAVFNIHFPKDIEILNKARHRLKFEELFFIQLRMLKLKLVRQEKFRGQVFNDASLLTAFYNNHLPFPLTDAQKRVVKEIYADLKKGQQMNRLLQGDVGSGKTIVAFICILIAIGSQAQCTLMAPTEILAQQHYKSLKQYADKMQVSIALLTGSTKKKQRTEIHKALQAGELNLLIGTHALLEEEVQFKNLGLAIIDEQHRFGVAQRSKLWKKNTQTYPHVLVMTATPIPRTLAMTLYGDLDISTIDQLPVGRKPIKTMHNYDAHRLRVNQFLREQIALGRQVYIVYPLIEESEKLDLKHLMDGYESVCRAFPEIAISILHGKMKPDAKDFEMARFSKGETKIMVATTVIEVGVDVPTATVMVIEHAERFGLAQLHQLRGRIGRGAAKSFCILMTGGKVTEEGERRLEAMVKTNDGFQIAELDLELRGPGEFFGTKQAGMPDFRVANLIRDRQLLELAKREAATVLAGPNSEVTQVEISRALVALRTKWQHTYGLVEVG